VASTIRELGDLVRIRTGKLDANANDPAGEFPFFTCAREPLRISSYSYDCECVLVAGNGDLNVKYYEGKFDAYQRTYIIESADKGLLDVRYLFHFMDLYLEQLRHLSIGGVIKYIKLGNLTEAKIPLPALPEQRRIAAILDQADALRAKRREALAELDKLSQAIFIEMFGDPVSNPKGHPLFKLGDVTTFENGDRSSNYPSGNDIQDSGVLFLSTKNIRDHRLALSTSAFITKEKFSSLSRGKARKGDILITLRGTLGSCCIFDCQYDTAFINAQMMIIRTKEGLRPEYLHALLTSGRFQDLFSRIGQGAAVPQLTAAQLAQLTIPIPPIVDQKNFAATTEATSILQREEEGHMSWLDSLFGSLQHRAFQGAL
jgi:type I restriction enzyme S subunit